MVSIFKPYMPEQLGELNDILYSGVLAYGKWGKLFEKELASFLGVHTVLTTNSYNAAMLVLVATLGLKAGDEILASPVSCLASNQPFVNKGLKIRWVDIDPQTGTIDSEAVRKNITANTKAIFHNHYCGMPGHIDEINQIAKEHNIFVIDDCIEAFGSEYKGRMLGNTGADAAVYSFQTVRLPNTIDGGALVFANADLIEKAKRIRDYGIDRACFRDENNEISANYNIDIEGYGALMSEVNSYIGYQQMKDIPMLLAKQRANALAWVNYLSEKHPSIKPLNSREDVAPNYWVFGMLTPDRLAMLKHFREIGYYASGIHINNNIYSVFGDQSSLTGVTEFVNSYLALPCGWWVEQNDL